MMWRTYHLISQWGVGLNTSDLARQSSLVTHIASDLCWVRKKYPCTVPSLSGLQQYWPPEVRRYLITWFQPQGWSTPLNACDAIFLLDSSHQPLPGEMFAADGCPLGRHRWDSDFSSHRVLVAPSGVTNNLKRKTLARVEKSQKKVFLDYLITNPLSIFQTVLLF